MSLTHIILSKFGGANEGVSGTSSFLNYLDDAKFTNYNALTETQCADIDKYLREFGYKFEKGKVEFGWIFQIFKSVKSGKFIFSAKAFPTDESSLRNIDPGTVFDDPVHHWKKSGNIMNKESTRHFDAFVKELKNPKSAPDDAQGTTLKEQFLGHLYNTIYYVQNS